MVSPNFRLHVVAVVAVSVVLLFQWGVIVYFYFRPSDVGCALPVQLEVPTQELARMSEEVPTEEPVGGRKQYENLKPFKKPSECKDAQYVVSTLIDTPFVERNSSGDWVGYNVDMLGEMMGELNFEYCIKEAKAYGSQQPDGSWNGIIEEVRTGRAHIGMQKMTVTPERQTVVNFTTPFINTSFTAIMRRESIYQTDAFLKPFDDDLWRYLGCAILVVSLSLFFLHWLQALLVKDEDPDLSTFKDSVWFTVKSLLNQSWDMMPVSFAGKLLATGWWFFCLVICSTYTANLAAFLTNLQHIPDTINHLLMQTKIKYGCLNSTTNCDFFKNSKVPLHQQAWLTMTQLWEGKYIFESYSVALNYVRTHSNFALFDDVSYFNYHLNVDCDLVIVPDTLANVSLAFIINVDHPELRTNLSKWIDSNSEELFEKWKKWWYNKAKGNSACLDTGFESAVISADKLRGLFLVLGGFVVAAFLFLFLRYIMESFVFSRLQMVLSSSSKRRYGKIPETSSEPEPSPQITRQTLARADFCCRSFTRRLSVACGDVTRCGRDLEVARHAGRSFFIIDMEKEESSFADATSLVLKHQRRSSSIGNLSCSCIRNSSFKSPLKNRASCKKLGKAGQKY
jgi:hypothetical protein